MNGPIPARWAPFLLSVLRIVTAFLYIAHGTQKLVEFPAAEPRPGVPLASLLGLASGLEIIAGTLLLVGLFTRPVAFLLAGEMAVVLFCFVWLYLAAAGAGAWSLDAWWGRRDGSRSR